MNPGMFNFILMIVFIAIIYFLMIRPQRKQDKEIKAMRDALKPGDEIITIGGIVGKIVRVKDDFITIQVGPEKVKFDMLKTAVGRITKQSTTKVNRTEEKEEEPEERIPSGNKKIKPKKLTAKKEDKDAK